MVPVPKLATFLCDQAGTGDVPVPCGTREVSAAVSFSIGERYLAGNVSCGKRRGSGGGRSSGGDSGSGSGSGSGRSRSRSSSSTVLSNSTPHPTLPSAPHPFRILLGVVLALLLGSFMVVLEVVLEVVSDVVLE